MELKMIILSILRKLNVNKKVFTNEHDRHKYLSSRIVSELIQGGMSVLSMCRHRHNPNLGQGQLSTARDCEYENMI